MRDTVQESQAGSGQGEGDSVDNGYGDGYGTLADWNRDRVVLSDGQVALALAEGWLGGCDEYGNFVYWPDNPSVRYRSVPIMSRVSRSMRRKAGIRSTLYNLHQMQGIRESTFGDLTPEDLHE